MEADDAFLSELLALLESCDEAPALAPVAGTSCHRRPPPNGVRTTDTLRALRAEASRLTDELERLRDGRSASHVAAMERALVERRKRKRAEQECDALRDAVYQHTRFVRGLDAIYCFRPRFSLRLNLCRYLHRHILLPRERSARWGDFDDVSLDARMQHAVEVLCHETATLSLAEDDSGSSATPEPIYNCEPVDDDGNHSFTHTSMYAIDTKDLSAVVRGACVAIRDVVTLCPLGHTLELARDIVDADASASRNVLYRVLGIKHRNANNGALVGLETHVLTSYKIADDHAVVLWDFVDDDQLHPLQEDTQVSREVTGACLIRREMCTDGVERTILRSLCTKRFRFKGDDVPLKYGCVNLESSYGNEMLFRKIIQDQVLMEETAVGNARALIDGVDLSASDSQCGCLPAE